MGDDLSPEAVELLRNLTASPSLTPKDQEAALELIAKGLAKAIQGEGRIQITKIGKHRAEDLYR